MGAVEDGEGVELLGDGVASSVCGLGEEPGGVVCVEVAKYYCVGEGVEVVKLELKSRGGG